MTTRHRSKFWRRGKYSFVLSWDTHVRNWVLLRSVELSVCRWSEYSLSTIKPFRETDGRKVLYHPLYRLGKHVIQKVWWVRPFAGRWGKCP